ncbi:MAG: hypothetical protein ABW352_12435 [Polyangiales bacterium]
MSDKKARPPHTPGYGGVVALTVILSAAIILTYTLLPLPGQRELGSLNYAAAVFLLVLTFAMVKRFRPAGITGEDATAKPRVRAGGERR